MDQLDIAVHQTAHDYGLPKLARKMGMNEQVLRNKCNPHADNSPLSLRQAIAMMDITDDYRILDAIEVLFGRFAAPVEQHGVDVVAAVLRAVAEHGDVARAVEDSLEDGRITPRELAGIREEIREAVTALGVLEGALIDAAQTEPGRVRPVVA